MSEVQFVRQLTDGKDTVFAYAPDGSPAWGIDLATGGQWWYPGGDQPIVRESIAAHWQSLTAIPPTGVAPDATSAAAPVEARFVDLRSHRPGHAVLARIAELHAMAFGETDVPVLPEEIITWSVGFIGEETVGAELARLGSGWTVLHAVPVGVNGSDIDHVVIGPAGVFCLNTKHHRGLNVDVKQDAVFVGGQFCRYMDALRLEAERTSAVVSTVAAGVPVHPLLVTVGARLRVKETPAVGTFLSHDQLVTWLLSQPHLVDTAQIAQLSEALSRSDNWSPVAPPPAAPEWVAELARSLATERALVSDQRRRGSARVSARRASSTVRPASAASRGRGRSGPGRSGKVATRRPPLILRLLGFAAAMATVVALLPVVVGAITSSIVSSVKVPSPRASAPVVAVVGVRCATKGTVSTDSAGLALICAPTSKAATASLVWRKKA